MLIAVLAGTIRLIRGNRKLGALPESPDYGRAFSVPSLTV